MPAYDNLDSTEKFWRRYEITLMDEQMKDDLEDFYTVDPYDSRLNEFRALRSTNWTYIWGVCIYYSVLIIGGNEMQPA